ncbi:hypothetical protein [Streptomyces sp. NBC_01198]|uniref:hypothetical protein n=1 Tax=Streptomyces sp. NBC_01198 TaxID=2903769 RepID=UPI002E12414C|nr:hypothetical protein OG702_24790 [Streptomyces sp. NBC_01198]
MGQQGEARRPAPEGQGGDGCLAAAIRLPIRVVAFVVVIPLRLLWEVLAVAGRAGGTAFRWVWRHVLAPPLAFVWRYLVVWPLVTLHRYVLVPVGIALRFLCRYLVVWPIVVLWRYVLAPIGCAVIVPLVRAIGTGAAYLVHYLLVVPGIFLWRRVVVPVAREVGAALALAWRVTSYVLRAVGRALAWTGRVLIALPVAWVWSWTFGPALRWFRRALWRPAAEAVAGVRRTVRRALLGGPAPAHRPPPAPPHRRPPQRRPAPPRAPEPAPVTPPAPAPAAYEPPSPAPAPVPRRPDPRKDFGLGGGERRTPPSHR